MPFIKQERRELIKKDQYASIAKTPEGIQPGDRCYYFYEQMVRKWKENPRWTTAHEIFKSMIYDDLETEDFVASRLAWQVFFFNYVMEYEKQKEEENGTI